LQGLSEVALEEVVQREKALAESGKTPAANVRVVYPDQAPVTVVVPQVVPEAPSDTGSTAVTPPPPASVPVATEQVSRVAQTGPFSGLIVDCRRLGVSPAMSPKIMAAGGREIWGTMMIDPEVAIERGIVAYYRTMEDARQSARAGENPLIIKAVGRAGRSRHYPSDAVVLDADGELILAENGKTKFLDKLNVCFVVDR
jgi:hypothetical protein